MSVRVTCGDDTQDVVISDSRPTSPNGKRVVLAHKRVGGRGLELGYGISPLPVENGTPLSGHDPEIAEQLKAMGYMVGDE